MAAPKEIVEVAGREVSISNPEKVYFPNVGGHSLEVHPVA